MEVKFWLFDGNNKYNQKEYTYEQAVEAFKSLKNCKNCVNCFGCYECYNQRELTRKFHKGENDE